MSATTAARCKKDRAPTRGNEVLSFDKTPLYTIIYQATDSCGNSAFAGATVTVPFSEGKKP